MNFGNKTITDFPFYVYLSSEKDKKFIEDTLPNILPGNVINDLPIGTDGSFYLENIISLDQHFEGKPFLFNKRNLSQDSRIPQFSLHTDNVDWDFGLITFRPESKNKTGNIMVSFYSKVFQITGNFISYHNDESRTCKVDYEGVLWLRIIVEDTRNPIPYYSAKIRSSSGAMEGDYRKIINLSDGNCKIADVGDLTKAAR